ncbi:Lcl C-terminal domain-containing protein [Burkholderia cenocepacia]|uniref:DUF1566 domain-containing protein n=1 Tax=Burkholderia cenocepacia TaxID=95486 RepID=UPI00097C4D64|nr:DUF1566 domain-containing protein [Burkholderia cenocepacia]AQQ20224.1 DUF1566 domain-containing protein [Burkholderia cenocepacia]ONJ19978.1 DUF1566 domain-containing protein [Burkholderia cenocepacia]ONN96041.1 DUF1566 domain-containing protein [Burkholderia cenocepacia]ONO14958.1 DUF1566 domain-containing protein [Burkholderia cenocepacia]ONO20882.1 DUF1566 domain-containing protein [Burkholderia cenocepacia]
MNAPTPTAVSIPQLAEGEIYVGIVTNTAGEQHHVVLLPGDNDDATWQAQMDWARSIGGDLPTRVEMLFLLANHRDQFEPDAYWSNQPDTDPGYSGWAWFQFFGSGGQGSNRQTNELRARAVRRLSI